MGQFSLKRLLVACTFVCIGVGVLATLPQRRFWITKQDWGNVAGVLSALGGLLVGIGISILLKKDTIWIAVAGIVIGMVIFVVTALSNFR